MPARGSVYICRNPAERPARDGRIALETGTPRLAEGLTARKTVPETMGCAACDGGKDATAPFRRRTEFPCASDGQTARKASSGTMGCAACGAGRDAKRGICRRRGFRALRTFCVAEQAVSRMVGCAARGMQGERKAALHRATEFFASRTGRRRAESALRAAAAQKPRAAKGTAGHGYKHEKG